MQNIFYPNGTKGGKNMSTDINVIEKIMSEKADKGGQNMGKALESIANVIMPEEIKQVKAQSKESEKEAIQQVVAKKLAALRGQQATNYPGNSFTYGRNNPYLGNLMGANMKYRQQTDKAGEAAANTDSRTKNLDPNVWATLQQQIGFTDKRPHGVLTDMRNDLKDARGVAGKLGEYLAERPGLAIDFRPAAAGLSAVYANTAAGNMLGKQVNQFGPSDKYNQLKQLADAISLHESRVAQTEQGLLNQLAADKETSKQASDVGRSITSSNNLNMFGSYRTGLTPAQKISFDMRDAKEYTKQAEALNKHRQSLTSMEEVFDLLKPLSATQLDKMVRQLTLNTKTDANGNFVVEFLKNQAKAKASGNPQLYQQLGNKLELMGRKMAGTSETGVLSNQDILAYVNAVKGGKNVNGKTFVKSLRDLAKRAYEERKLRFKSLMKPEWQAKYQRDGLKVGTFDKIGKDIEEWYSKKEKERKEASSKGVRGKALRGVRRAK